MTSLLLPEDGSILERSGTQITPTSLTLIDPDLAWEHFEDLGRFLGKMNRACSWWVGDLILYGEQMFGHNHAQIEDALGLAPQTIANRASVCRHIPPSQRRAALPFGVHAEVAYLEPAERERWLDRAELGQWTRAKLREEMRVVREINSDGSVSDLAETDDLRNGPISLSKEEGERFKDVLGLSSDDHVCPACGHSWSED